jgi:hypothetical protein
MKWKRVHGIGWTEESRDRKVTRDVSRLLIDDGSCPTRDIIK